MRLRLIVCLICVSGSVFAFDPSQQLQGDQLLVYQGDLAKLGSTPLAVAQKLAAHDVIAISHVKSFSAQVAHDSLGSNWINPSACQDSAYPHMRELLKLTRQLKPRIRIFGYVAPTADAPYASDCGNRLVTGSSWSCPNEDCANFKKWVQAWLQIESLNEGIWIDGFLVDLVASQYLTPAHRDSVFQYIKSKGKHIMANTPMFAYNVDFAAASAYFNTGDYALVEGFYYGLGALKTDPGFAGANAAATYLKWRQRGKNFRLAALTTERWASIDETFNCGTPNNFLAYATFVAYFERGNVYQYTSGDLGINTPHSSSCWNLNAYSMLPYYAPTVGQPTP